MTFFPITDSISVIKPLKINLGSKSESYPHGWKKLGSWEAPSQEIYRFGGDILASGGKFPYFARKNTEEIMDSMTPFPGNKH